jgi:hypothetical protein
MTKTFKGISQDFAAAGNSAAREFFGDFNVHIAGTFVATVVLERRLLVSIDDNNVDNPVWTDYAPVEEFTEPTTKLAYEPEPRVQYRLRCSDYTSGTVEGRVSCA